MTTSQPESTFTLKWPLCTVFWGSRWTCFASLPPPYSLFADRSYLRRSPQRGCWLCSLMAMVLPGYHHTRKGHRVAASEQKQPRVQMRAFSLVCAGFPSDSCITHVGSPSSPLWSVTSQVLCTHGHGWPYPHRRPPALPHRPTPKRIETCPTQSPSASSSGPTGNLSLENWAHSPLPSNIFFTSYTPHAALSAHSHCCTFTYNLFSDFHSLLFSSSGPGFEGRNFTESLWPVSTAFLWEREQHGNRLYNIQSPGHRVHWSRARNLLHAGPSDPTDCMTHSESYLPKGSYSWRQLLWERNYCGNPTTNHDLQETFRQTAVFYSLGNEWLDCFNDLANGPSSINNIYSLNLSNVPHRTEEF